MSCAIACFSFPLLSQPRSPQPAHLTTSSPSHFVPGWLGQGTAALAPDFVEVMGKDVDEAGLVRRRTDARFGHAFSKVGRVWVFSPRHDLSGTASPDCRSIGVVEVGVNVCIHMAVPLVVSGRSQLVYRSKRSAMQQQSGVARSVSWFGARSVLGERPIGGSPHLPLSHQNCCTKERTERTTVVIDCAK